MYRSWNSFFINSLPELVYKRCTKIKERQKKTLFRINQISMVEAAGVEPASEGVVSREPTYLVAFTLGGCPTFAARAENATRNASR